MVVSIDRRVVMDRPDMFVVNNGDQQRFPQPAVVDLAVRFGDYLESIPDQGRVLSIGMTHPAGEILTRKFPEVSERDITVTPFPGIKDFVGQPNTFDSVIGNIKSGEGLDDTVARIIDVAKPESTIMLNIHDDKEPIDESELDVVFAEAGIHLTGFQRPERGQWWEIKAAKLPEHVIPLRMASQRARVYGGLATAGEIDIVNFED